MSHESLIFRSRLLPIPAGHVFGHLSFGVAGGHPLHLFLHRPGLGQPDRPCLVILRLHAVPGWLPAPKKKSLGCISDVPFLFCSCLDDPVLFQPLNRTRKANLPGENASIIEPNVIPLNIIGKKCPRINLRLKRYCYNNNLNCTLIIFSFLFFRR